MGELMSNLDKKINAMNPGQSVKISGDSKCWVEAERSGDGKRLTFVRCTPNTSTVFKRCAF